jgi:hypothetical protein
MATITEKQASFIRSLVVELELAEDVDAAFDSLYAEMTISEASSAIDGLLQIRAERKAQQKATVEVHSTVTEPALPEGYFTVEFGELYDGEETHRTFRVKDASSQSKLAGKRIISLLVGSNNESDYTGVGFVDADGVKVWKRFSGDSVMREAIDILTGDVESAQMGYAMRSGNCYVCGRLLTEPESIKLGIGPVCREG